MTVGPERLDAARLAAAKLWITTPTSVHTPNVGDAPYLSHALYAMPAVASQAVDDAAADDRWNLYLNPAWLERTEIAEVGCRIAHLTLHLLFDHAGRARSMEVGRAEATAWQQAADTSTGDALAYLDLEQVHALRQAAGRAFPDGLSTEERYATLGGLSAVPKPDWTDVELPDCGSCVDGLLRESESAGDGKADFEATLIRRAVAIDYQAHRRGRGDTPGDFIRLAAELAEPVVPWARVLSASVRRGVGWSRGLVDYTYSRRSRRQAALPDIVLAGMRAPSIDIAIVVDTSASVDDGLLGQAVAEVSGTLSALGTPDASVHVLATDAAVHTVERVRRGSPINLAGGGGTDVRVGLAAVDELRPRKPSVVIVLTDGETPWPADPPPGVRVIVGLLGRYGDALPPTPPWAVRVECVPA